MIWLFLAGIVVAWLAGQVLGWSTTYRRDGGPFNWRIALGPWIYWRWWDKSEDWWQT